MAVVRKHEADSERDQAARRGSIALSREFPVISSPTGAAARGGPARLRSGLALGGLLALGGVVVLVLIVFAGGYGYHRDELYFLVAGDHLDWSFPDQGR